MYTNMYVLKDIDTQKIAMVWLTTNKGNKASEVGITGVAASYATKIVYILTSGQLLYNNNISDVYNANKVPLGFLRHFQGMDCVDFYPARMRKG